nr:MAG TPA: hypothetical protein [Caudoviricetes sp.]
MEQSSQRAKNEHDSMSHAQMQRVTSITIVNS